MGQFEIHRLSLYRFELWHSFLAVVQIPEELVTSPMSLMCARCSSRPGHDCIQCEGQFAHIHIERIEAAAELDEGQRDNNDF